MFKMNVYFWKFWGTLLHLLVSILVKNLSNPLLILLQGILNLLFYRSV